VIFVDLLISRELWGMRCVVTEDFCTEFGFFTSLIDGFAHLFGHDCGKLAGIFFEQLGSPYNLGGAFFNAQLPRGSESLLGLLVAGFDLIVFERRIGFQHVGGCRVNCLIYGRAHQYPPGAVGMVVAGFLYDIKSLELWLYRLRWKSFSVTSCR